MILVEESCLPAGRRKLEFFHLASCREPAHLALFAAAAAGV